jgi:hypothetical protein
MLQGTAIGHSIRRRTKVQDRIRHVTLNARPAFIAQTAICFG